ncbi:MAG: septal ring lytic transglycosylase RlpA family protein [Patescibacteria group bacterium]|nr:septal ring lytic transglycosylase RlpA family protein [Patescibacteria group bacterium]
MNRYLQYIFVFLLLLSPVFVFAQNINSRVNTPDTSINYTYVTLPKSLRSNIVNNSASVPSNTVDTSINYTYETLPKKYFYDKDTQIGILERELYKKTASSTISGISHWYGAKFQGRKMANGEKFDMNNPTIVAHRNLKLGTKLKITNIKNGNFIYAIVGDRGPYTYKWAKDKNGNKIKKYLAEIDVSYAGAKLLGIDKSGTGNVKIEIY